ncbi:hypothetical protein [Pseudomonas sp. 22 E 5]|nr:hypothetical protein [Pseudomonas sp. 22 E 5]
MTAMLMLFDRGQLGAVVVAMFGAMFGAMVMIMVVGVIMFFRGVDGIAHSVASVKVPVAK